MTNDRLAAIESTLQQLVAGQATFGARFDGIDDRLDRLQAGQKALRAKVDTFTEAQKVFEQTMTRQFGNLREEFDRRLVPLEIAVRRIAAAAPGHNGRPSGSRKRTPRG